MRVKNWCGRLKIYYNRECVNNWCEYFQVGDDKEELKGIRNFFSFWIKGVKNMGSQCLTTFKLHNEAKVLLKSK